MDASRPDPPDQIADSTRKRSALKLTLESAGIASLAGTLAGFVWGGVGERVAMRILFLTSNDRVRGVISDDGFEIGVVSLMTIFLLVFTSIIGAFAGLVYGVLRVWLSGPRWVVVLSVAVTAAVSGGALIIDAEGIDFRVLDPLWLAVGLFILIPGAWGITVTFLTDWLSKPGVLFPETVEPLNVSTPGRRGRVISWLALATIAALGIAGLIGDLAELS